MNKQYVQVGGGQTRLVRQDAGGKYIMMGGQKIYQQSAGGKGRRRAATPMTCEAASDPTDMYVKIVKYLGGKNVQIVADVRTVDGHKRIFGKDVKLVPMVVKERGKLSTVKHTTEEGQYGLVRAGRLHCIYNAKQAATLVDKSLFEGVKYEDLGFVFQYPQARQDQEGQVGQQQLA